MSKSKTNQIKKVIAPVIIAGVIVSTGAGVSSITNSNDPITVQAATAKTKTAPTISGPSKINTDDKSVAITSNKGSKVTATYAGKKVTASKVAKSDTKWTVKIPKPVKGAVLVVSAKGTDGTTKKLSLTTEHGGIAPTLTAPSKHMVTEKAIKVTTNKTSVVTATYNGKKTTVSKVAKSTTEYTVKISKPVAGQVLVISAKGSDGTIKKVTLTTEKAATTTAAPSLKKTTEIFYTHDSEFVVVATNASKVKATYGDKKATVSKSKTVTNGYIVKVSKPVVGSSIVITATSKDGQTTKMTVKTEASPIEARILTAPSKIDERTKSFTITTSNDVNQVLVETIADVISFKTTMKKQSASDIKNNKKTWTITRSDVSTANTVSTGSNLTDIRIYGYADKNVKTYEKTASDTMRFVEFQLVEPEYTIVSGTQTSASAYDVTFKPNVTYSNSGVGALKDDKIKVNLYVVDYTNEKNPVKKEFKNVTIKKTVDSTTNTVTEFKTSLKMTAEEVANSTIFTEVTVMDKSNKIQLVKAHSTFEPAQPDSPWVYGETEWKNLLASYLNQ